MLSCVPPVFFALCLSACAAGYVSESAYDGGDGAGSNVAGEDGTGSGGTSGNQNSNFVAAAHPAAMQLTLNAPAAVLQAPKLRVITFNNDTNATQLEAFATQLAASSYWTSVVTQYGVGPLTVAAPVRAAFSWPAHTTDGDVRSGQPSDIENYLISQLDVAAPPWGAPDANTVYMLFMPSGVAVSADAGQSASACASDILSWHTAMTLPRTNVTITYVVEPYCGALQTLTLLDSRTFAASGEILTTVTNPHLNGYAAIDPNHAYWQLAGSGADIGAACVAQQYGSANLAVHPADLPFAVQRMWSNAAALAGHTPCLPAQPNAVFFNAVPVVSTKVLVSVTHNPLIAAVSTLGVHVAAGTKAVVPLNLFSDGVLAGGWSVTAHEVTSGDLTLTLDSAQGSNGTVLHLTIQMSSAPKTPQQLVRITSVAGGVSNSDYLVVHS